MRKCLWLFFCLSLTTLQAQYFEAGVLVGASNYRGDLSSNSSKIYLNESHFSSGLFARYNLHTFGAVRLGLNYGKLSGKDANATQAEIRQRNLSFETGFFELALTGEFNFPGYQPYNLERPLSPYLFGGFAVFKFNPTTQYLGERVGLAKLGTEGQGMSGRLAPYKLIQFSIPLGVGVKYALNDTWNLGIELGVRRAFSDYVDDVSTTYVNYNDLLAGNGDLAAALGNREGEYLGTEPVVVPTGTPRGDNKPVDWYMIAGITISYNFLDNGLVGFRGHVRRKKSGCKTD